MCLFISWIEKDKDVYFLTGDQLFRSETGRTCREQSGNLDDYTGHGMIRLFYNLVGGRDMECSDFSTPKNFPVPIQIALLSGEMSGFPFPEGILITSLYDNYAAKRKLLDDDHIAKCKPLDDDYDAKRKPLDDDYAAKCKPLDDDYYAKRKLLTDDYVAKYNLLDDDYFAKYKLLDGDYAAKRNLLTDDYGAKCKLLNDEMWELVKSPENIAEAWR